MMVERKPIKLPEGEQALRTEYVRLKALIADSKVLEEGDELE
jgi:hypothetical protein